MAQDFGNGVSRTLSALERQFQVVVWQSGKPPLDSELNLMMQADWERLSNTVRALLPSGWLIDPFNSDNDFVTNPNWSNWFKIGTAVESETSPALWANVNGWLVPVTGTGVADGDPSNRVNLFPPPTSDARADFVFLEVWLAQVGPNPSTSNKPSATTVYKWGNTEFGGTNIPDDLQDPNIGFETTERVQLQYRLRVVGRGTGLGDAVDLSTFPDGLDDPDVLAQGTASAPQAGFIWENMRGELGDPGLWRSGDGDADNALGTVDGYSYAIPLCAVFRRNETPFGARTDSGNANQNGALNRNPYTAGIVDPIEGTRTFTAITLTNDLNATDGDVPNGEVAAIVEVDGLAGSGFDNPDITWSGYFLQVGEEVFGISGVDTSVLPGTITITSRGRNGTQGRPHLAGSEISFYQFRPDGFSADQITQTDILDLRKAVSPSEWDYQALLEHNLGKLFSNTLRSSYKQAAGSDTQGPVIIGVDTLCANPSVSPSQNELLDGPDGIRTVFSDAAVLESASLLAAPLTGGVGNPTEVSDYEAAATSWPSTGFDPSGWQSSDQGWSNGAIIDLEIGGATTNDGARGTIRTTDNRFVRFASPREMWLSRDDFANRTGMHGAQTPIQIRFKGDPAVQSTEWGEPAAGGATQAERPGPMFPLPELDFEGPFIFLGGVVNSDLYSTNVQAFNDGSTPSGLSTVRFAGLDFDAGWVADPANPRELSVEGVSNLLLNGSRNLYDMISNGGQDPTGASSELYLVLRGSTTNPENVGVFRVIGAGTIGYTSVSGATAEDLVVESVGVRWGGVNVPLEDESNLTAGVRSQYTHTQDGNLVAASVGASACIVFTDIGGGLYSDTNPWNGLVTAPLVAQAIIDTKVVYGPSRGGVSRVPLHLDRIGLVQSSANLVRESKSALDPNFPAEAGVPASETYFPTQAIQVWNQLPALGLRAPLAPDYGEGTYWKDQRRDAEVFVDPGSKTLILRPLRQVDLTMLLATTPNALIPSTYLPSAGGGTVDGGSLFVTSLDRAYSFPWEYMPKFGRQDIPYHQTLGAAGPVYVGVNHLFGDSQDENDDVFRMVGGVSSTAAGNGVQSLFFETGSSSGADYGEYHTISGPADGYQARIYEDVSVYSSDLPQKGLKGIQLPPFLGIARVYGVYDRREFDAAAGQGAYNADRVTLSTVAGRPKNLLKTDADKQTLYIVRGGAEDVTGNAEDHTYLIPADAIDVSLSGQWSSGETFDDFEFVVECVVFGFARGFISQNNYILQRRYLPDGTDGTTVAAVAGDVSTILPLPLPSGEQVYAAYRRVPYQGDPFMTRDGATKTTSDYEFRLGQIPQASAFNLGTSIQQYDSTDNFSQIPQIPNPRALEVLASVDFWTTLGTGKMSGPVFPGTYTDVAHLTNDGAAPTRVPLTNSEPIWQSEPRTFTEGQPAEGRNATSAIEITDNALLGVTVRFSRKGYTDVTFEFGGGGSNPAVGADIYESAANLAGAILRSEPVFVMGAAARGAGNSVVIQALLPGKQGEGLRITLEPASGSRSLPGIRLFNTNWGFGDHTLFSSPLNGAADLPMNGSQGSASTPIRMAGLTERLPLGILVQDADFIGEDPLRDGTSSLVVSSKGGSGAPSKQAPVKGAEEWARMQANGFLGMADGGVLQYQPYSLTTPSGTRKFRLYRGGGSLYVLNPDPAGGPVDWVAGGLPEGAKPVVKGAVLAGRAYLVRNYPEEAFATPQRRSWGDELQMVIVTEAEVGQGPLCGHGYALDGQISPTGWGEGFAAADRYRLEGKPLSTGRSAVSPDPDLSGNLAPYPSEDPSDDPCA